jgi:hypothetical protein
MKKSIDMERIIIKSTRMPDFDKMGELELVRKRADYRVKLGVLRREFPSFLIPDFDEDTDLKIVHTQFDRYVCQIKTENSVGTYKTYLVVFWLVLELGLVKGLGLKFSGFVKNQVKSMHRYDTLLSELGEKGNIGFGEGWPVEVRLGLLCLFQAVVFLILQYLSNWVSPGLATIIQNLISGFMAKEEPAAGVEGEEDPTDIPARGGGGGGLADMLGGLDIGGLVVGLLGGGGRGGATKKKARANRRPAFAE